MPNMLTTCWVWVIRLGNYLKDVISGLNEKVDIRQVMIKQLLMQHTLGMLHFEKQLFTAAFSAKHAHYLQSVDDKVGE